MYHETYVIFASNSLSIYHSVKIQFYNQLINQWVKLGGWRIYLKQSLIDAWSFHFIERKSDCFHFKCHWLCIFSDENNMYLIIRHNNNNLSKRTSFIWIMLNWTKVIREFSSNVNLLFTLVCQLKQYQYQLEVISSLQNDKLQVGQ